MKISLQCVLISLSIAFVSSCKTSNNMSNEDTFGTMNNTTLKVADLSPQEKSSLINAQKQVYETAQRILENHYLEAWFTNYEINNKFSTLKEAKKDYYTKQAIVTDVEVTQFIKENGANQQLLKIPESQRAQTVKQYLKKVAEAHSEQTILSEAYKQNKLKLIAFKKPQEPIVQFETRGHIYDTSIQNPKVTIVEFADYQCPFCVKANPEIMKLISTYKGQIQYVFMDFPLLDKHPQALPAALAAKCAENQGKYWEMHNAIFDRAPMDELSTNKYTTIAKKLNLDLIKFNQCQNDPTQKESIETDLNEGLRVGVNETPTIYINGQKFDDYITFENLKSSVETHMDLK